MQESDGTPAEKRDHSFKELTNHLMELAVHIGLISSVMSQYPEIVQEGWQERLEEIDRWVTEQIGQVQEFGSAYDED